jgi:hypothetical protein
MPGVYRRLRLVGAKMKCESLMDVLLTMIEEQTILELDEGFRAELPGHGDHADNGRQVAYGKKTKAKQHRTPDSVADDQRFHQTHIVFDDYDREVADIEAGYKPEDWEGEYRDR